MKTKMKKRTTLVTAIVLTLAMTLMIGLGLGVAGAEVDPNTVAMIGNKEYTSLITAVSEAQKDDVIQVIKDTTITSWLQTKTDCTINIQDGVTVSIGTNGLITNYSSESVHFTGNGTITSVNGNSPFIFSSGDNSKYYMESGKYIGADYIFQMNAVNNRYVYISGGYYQFNTSLGHALQSYYHLNFYISGGYFNKDISEWCTGAYKCVALESTDPAYDLGYRYTVVPVTIDDNPGAAIGDAYYMSFDGALGAVQSGETIKLLADYPHSVSCSNGKTFSLDLNGYTITNDSSNTDAFNISNNTKVIIKDTSTGTKGTIQSNAGDAIWMASYGCDVTVQDGVQLLGRYAATVQSSSYLNTTTVNFENAAVTASTGIFKASNIKPAISGGTYNYNPTEFVVTGYGVTDNQNGTWTVSSPAVKLEKDGKIFGGYASIADALAGYASGGNGTYVLTIKDSSEVYNVGDLLIEEYTTKPLTVKAATKNGVTLKYQSDGTHNSNTIFNISGMSSGTGSVTFENLKFDLSGGAYFALRTMGGGSGAYDKYFTDVVGRYARNITCKNCTFVGASVEGSSVLNADAGTQPGHFLFDGCTVTDVDNFFSGYGYQTSGGHTDEYGIKVKDCTVTNVNRFLNNQGSNSTSIVEGCTVSSFNDYSIRTLSASDSASSVIVKDSSITNTCSTEKATSGGIIVCRGNDTVTVTNSVFSKPAGFYDVQNPKNRNITIKSGSHLVDKLETGSKKIGELKADKALTSTDAGYNFMNVAQIGDDTYSTLSDAVNAATTGGTIIILADITDFSSVWTAETKKDLTFTGKVSATVSSTDTGFTNGYFSVDPGKDDVEEGYIAISANDKEGYTYKVVDRIVAADQLSFIYGDIDKSVGATYNGGALSYAVTSGSDVVAVDSTTGALTIKKAGTAVVTVTAAASGGYDQYSKEINITVLKASQNAPAKGEGYTISGTTLKAESGYELYNGTTTDNEFTITDGTSYYIRKAEVTDQKYASPYTPIDTTVSISVMASPVGMGTVSISGVNNGKCSIGTSVTVTATPAASTTTDNYEFVGWQNAKGETVSTTNPYTFTATCSTTLIAVFKVQGKTRVEIPSASNKTYNEAEQTGVEANEAYTLTGETATAAGYYTATASLKNTTTTVWSDGTVTNKTIVWRIYKADQPAPTGVSGTDNFITGVTTAMEYKAKSASEYTAITDTTVTNLAAGTYYVRLKGDDNHNASPAVVVTVSEPTLNVVTVQTTALTVNSAILRGAVSPFSEKVTAEGFRYKQSDANDWTTVNVADGSKAATFSAEITGLTQDTEYVAQAFAKNAAGTTYGNTYVFHTVAAQTPSVNIGEISAGAIVEGTVPKKVIISVEEGNDVIASAISQNAIVGGTTFKATFSNLPDGNYNVVVRTEDGSFTETRMVTIENGAVVSTMFTIPVGKLSTVVDVKTSETPKVAVEGLPDILTDTEKNEAAVGSKEIEVKMEAEVKAETSNVQAETHTTEYAISQIQTLIPEATETVEEKIETVLDLSLTKTVTEMENGEVKSVEVKDIGSENTKVIEVAVPYVTSGKTLKVYRYHDGVPEELVALSSRPGANFIDGTYFIGEDYVFIYASGFSTYAITNEETKTPDPTEDDPTEDDGDNEYKITVAKTDNGKVTVSEKKAAKSEKITITVTPDAGYELDTISVIDSKGKAVTVKKVSDTKYTFIMPGKKVTVTVTFKKIGEEQTQPTVIDQTGRFVDVTSADYYYDAVEWAVANGFTSGVDANHFAPQNIITRAQIITFIWRASGCPEPVGSSAKFTDVSYGSYYEKAVIWGVEQGIVKGTSLTTFSPGRTVTRGQAVAFLARLAGVTDQASGYSHNFVDVPINSYYYNAVAWATTAGIAEGISYNTFGPDQQCLRGQAISFLYRYFRR